MVWRGVGGLRWNQVLAEAVAIGRVARGPSVLVTHAGGNDICFLRMDELITIIKADLDRIPSFYNNVVLVWSEIVPRVIWQGARNAGAVERARRTINARVSRSVRSLVGAVVRHRQLEGDNRQLMEGDGIHLNEIGLDIFLSGLQDGIEQTLFLLGGGRRSV